jgi:two-component system response regulator YesN
VNTVFLENDNLSSDPETLFKLVFQFVNALYSALNLININFEEICPKEQVEKEVESLYSIDQLKAYLAGLLENGQMQNNSMQNKSASAIKVLQSYIDVHFQQEITLKDLSDQVYLNPKYICELFKKEMGMNFNYLMNPCNRISEISAMVGYNDIKYFSRLFKKIVGVNPSQFRKLHS